MLNKVMLIGNLGKDPEVKHTQGGKVVCNFPIATTEKFRSADGEKQERTEWHAIIAWGKLAEVCGEHLAKGRTVFIEGRLATRKWEKDGITHYKTEIVAQNIRFLGGGNGGKSREKEAPQSAASVGGGEPTDHEDPFDGEIPF